jgi:acyl-CoA synthetase (AMP-forming)/AMP-acid ligase II
MEAIMQRFSEHGARVAVVDGGREHSYADLVAAVERRRARLEAAGIAPHQTVVLRGDFCFESIALFLALAGNRNVVVPLVNPQPATWQALAQSCPPDHVIEVGAEVTVTRPPPSPAGDAPAGDAPLVAQLRAQGRAGLILLSSGSTGVPKVILHDLSQLIEAKLDNRMGTGKLSIILFLLFDHIGGLNTLLNTLTIGSTTIVVRERTPEEVCALIERHRARVLPTSPTFLNLLLIGDFPSKHDLSSLRLITYGTEPMPEQLLQRVRKAFPLAKLLQTFGTSETGISTTVSESSESTYFRIDDARFEYRVVDGELHLRSKTQFLGYLNAQASNVTADGWFCTGDLVEAGDAGYFRIRGRASEMINVGGEKVLPLEVESLLLSSPLVEDCVVYGEANAITGQHVCAEVKMAASMAKSEARSYLQGFLADKVQAYKIPARIRFVDEIARSERFKKKRQRS